MFWVLQHSDVQISIRQPINRIFQVVDCSKDYFCIELVRQKLEHLTLKWDLKVQQPQVVPDFLVTSNYHSFSFCVEMWSACSAEHLHNVLKTDLNPSPLFGRIYLSAFYDDCMGRQVHTPGQSCCWYQNVQVSISEQLFDQVSIWSR